MPITQPEALPQPVEAMPQRYTILMPTVDTRIYGHHITYMHGDQLGILQQLLPCAQAVERGWS